MINRFPYRENDPALPCDNCGRDIGQDEVICRKCFDEWKDKEKICVQGYNELLKAKDELEDTLQKKIDELEEELIDINELKKTYYKVQSEMADIPIGIKISPKIEEDLIKFTHLSHKIELRKPTLWGIKIYVHHNLPDDCFGVMYPNDVIKWYKIEGVGEEK